MEMEGASMFSHRLNACPQIDYLLLCFRIFGPAGGYRILFVRHAQIRLHPTSQLTVFIVCTKKAFHKFCCSKVSHSTYFETNIIYAHDGILPPPLFPYRNWKRNNIPLASLNPIHATHSIVKTTLYAKIQPPDHCLRLEWGSPGCRDIRKKSEWNDNNLTGVVKIRVLYSIVVVSFHSSAPRCLHISSL